MRPILPWRHIFAHVQAWVCEHLLTHTCGASLSHLEVTCGVEKEVAWFEVSVENIGRVDVLEAPEDLV